MVAAVAGDEEIVEPVVIVIADGNAMCVTEVSVQAGACRYVGERAVVVVVVEGATRSIFDGVGRVGWTGLEEQDVQKAIVIVVEEGAARRGALHEVVLPLCAVGVNESDAGALGDILEKRRRCLH